MSHPSGSWSQRPKGFKVKQTLQVTLLFAVGFWLLYQIKTSHNKSKDYGSNDEKKLRKEEGIVALGRKGNAGSSDEIMSDDRNPLEEGEKVEDGGGGDDELDRNAEEKVEEESLHKEHDDSEESIVKHQEANQKLLDTAQEESQSQRNGEANTDTQPKDLDEAVRSDIDQNTKKYTDETVLPPTETDITSSTDQRETENEGDGFHDVNGVPPDGHELVSATTNEKTTDEQTTSLDEETTSGPNTQPELGENTTDVEMTTDELEASNNISVVVAKTDSSSNGETGSNVGDNIDKSSINETSENKGFLTFIPSEKRK